MNEEMVKRLLETKNKDEIIDILEEKEKLLENLDLWDGRVINHVLKITNMTYEELKEEVCPTDILI